MILLAEGIALNFFFPRRGRMMPLHGGQEIVTLSLVTSKQLRADDFSLFLTLFG
jgi:hypothetical protein